MADSKPKIWLSKPHLSGEEHAFVQEAFEQNWVAPMGPHVDAFERELADYLGGSVHVVALSSGTAAIHLALVLLGITQGDEVLCQSLTFAGSANPATYLGAQPVFIDSEETTLNISPEFLEKAIIDRRSKGKKVKAIIPVHLYGMPAQMDAINEIAARFEIPVVEDAAEAVGSQHHSSHCGTLGDIGIFSFNGNKIITTSGGGALITKKKEVADRARFLAMQARDEAVHYEHSTIGYNYRLSNISAGIGRGQLKILPERVNQRREIFNWYQKLFSAIPGVTLLPEPEGMHSNRWLTTIILNPEKNGGITREVLQAAFEKENIDSRPLWKPMHLQPVYKGAPFYGDGTADRLFAYGLCLPSSSNLTEEERERIKNVIVNTFTS